MIACRIPSMHSEHLQPFETAGRAMTPTDGANDNDGHLKPRTARALDRRLGERIQRKRLERGVSADRLGAELGISAQQILEFEVGFTRVGTQRLIQIARLLDCTPAWFFQPDQTEKMPIVAQGPERAGEV